MNILLQQLIHNQTFRFRLGVSFCVISQQMETLLLADPEAISLVGQSRGIHRDPVSRPREQLETIQNPKDYLTDLLTRAGLQYTVAVAREISEHASLHVIRRFCPLFEDFVAKVTDP